MTSAAVCQVAPWKARTPWVLPAWRRVGFASAVIVLCATVSDMFGPGPLEDSDVMNPFGTTGALGAGIAMTQDVVDLLALPLFAAAIAVPIIRFRRARCVELATVVTETVQPQHVTVWLHTGARR
jgi:hypothetical protein